MTIAVMRFAWLLAAVVIAPGLWSGQATGVLHVTVTLSDPAEAPAPVARHALLISDNPATAAPRRVLTSADGTVTVALPPGSYIVESDRPVMFRGTAYQWTQVIDIVAGGAVRLALSAANAEATTAAPADAAAAAARPESDPSFLFGTWHESVAAVWSPTARASAFLVDARGLLATSSHAIGAAATVQVQVSPAVKVPARVLVSAPASQVAIVWIDPAVFAGRAALPIDCPSTRTALDDGDEITTIVAPLRRPVDQAFGTVTALAPRAIDTDLRLAFGGAGGPVFGTSGAVVGLTALTAASEPQRGADVVVIRATEICAAISSARDVMGGGAPPAAVHLPVEPARAFPADALATAAKDTAMGHPPTASSTSFDVTLLTPPMLARAAERADRTGGTSPRAPEMQARLGRLTDFGAWSEYFADFPPVVTVRVTPKLVESFWKRLAREAARTQGAALPAFKDFSASFLRLRASCGSDEVTPLHPFVLEHRVSAQARDTVREGLYVFDPHALGPHCATVTLTLYSERAPENGETVLLPAGLLERVWQDFAPYRKADVVLPQDGGV